MRRLFVTILLPAICSLAIACADDSTAGPPGGMEDYVPDAPIAYDARYLDGSFEGSLGTGWDTCHTRTPGKVARIQSGGSEGNSYVTIESGVCEGVCSPTNPSASHLYTWFSSAPSATARMGLYFDVKNLGGTGAAVRRACCASTAPTWSASRTASSPRSSSPACRCRRAGATRCVTVTGPGADTAIGISVQRRRRTESASTPSASARPATPGRSKRLPIARGLRLARLQSPSGSVAPST